MQMIMAPLLSAIKIVKYLRGQNYSAYKQNNCILPDTN